MPGRNPPPGKTKMTINLSPELKRRIKTEAVIRDSTIQDLVIRAIERELNQESMR